MCVGGGLAAGWANRWEAAVGWGWGWQQLLRGVGAVLTWFCGAVPLQVRTLGETVRLDARTKLLNPKWYEGMLSR